MKSKHKQAVAQYYNKHTKPWNDAYEGHYDLKSTSFEVPHRRSIILRLIDEYAGNKTLRIIDVGCGTGVLLKDIVERGHCAVGVDISEKMVEAAREAASQLLYGENTCLQADIESLPFVSRSFDGVICAGVLSHQPNYRNSISEISRIVKKDGIVLLTLPNILKLHNLLDVHYYLILFGRLIGKILPSNHKNKRSIKEYVMDDALVLRKYYYGQLNRMFRFNGLRVRETVSCGYGPLTFWRKEVFNCEWSMKLSTFLEMLAATKLFWFLNIFANSWVIRLEKIQ